MKKGILIIPDVHGRDFWKEAIERKDYEKAVFLGDYSDPYDIEGITDDVAIDNFEQLFGAVKVLFDLPDNKFIFDVNDKKNPVLELGINNGLMMAAERLLESNMSIDKVVILLRLDKQQEKILRMKYAR